MALVPCTACGAHHYAGDCRCPHCDAVLRRCGPSPLLAAAGAALLAVACTAGDGGKDRFKDKDGPTDSSTDYTDSTPQPLYGPTYVDYVDTTETDTDTDSDTDTDTDSDTDTDTDSDTDTDTDSDTDTDTGTKATGDTGPTVEPLYGTTATN